MVCLLIAATPFEIAPFLDHYRESEKTWLLDLDMDILITGIGLTACTYQLTRQIGLRRPDLVVQAGVAGSFEKGMGGHVFAIREDRIADEGVFERKTWKDLQQLGLRTKTTRPYHDGWIVNPNKVLLRRSRLRLARSVTVNEISTSVDRLRVISKQYQAQLESMEGAALHYVCAMEEIPFLQIRSVSNLVGDRNKKNWQMDLAITHLNKELIRLLESL